MKKNSLIAVVPLILVASLIGTFIGHVDAPSISPRAQISALDTLGHGALPDWDADAQVKLGWIFDDPTNPQDSTPLEGWNTAIGDIPIWDYNSTREAFGEPGQWYIKIPNLINDNPAKKFWISWVYEFDSYIEGPRSVTNLDWYPDEGYTNFLNTEEWFDSVGNPTDDHELASTARVTQSLEMNPNPEYEEVWLGVKGSGKRALEVYIETLCVIELEPEPVIIGPGELPEWHEDAQVQLGWIFDDPTNPQDSVPLEGWNTAIGDTPVWSYDKFLTLMNLIP
ncbi:MAG: hypothetical protein ACW981_21590 [Candidatus Hodarchaeales archaeon]|jgi:hypothetical protein